MQGRQSRINVIINQREMHMQGRAERIMSRHLIMNRNGWSASLHTILLCGNRVNKRKTAIKAVSSGRAVCDDKNFYKSIT